MPSAILAMHREAIAEGLMNRLDHSPEINFIYEPNYENTNTTINSYKAKVALIEVAESGYYDMDYCLRLCKELRKDTPECKLILMCSEEDENNIKEVVNAKAKNHIDDFVFYDVTIDYLASKLISI